MITSARSRLIRAALVALVAALPASSAFASAPRQLYNKTIQMSWTVSVTFADGSTSSSSGANTVYVSSAGRLFERGSRAWRSSRKQTENAPGATRSAGGEATNVRFQGSQLVGSTAFIQGARRYVASFDASFTSCTVQVTFGKEGGVLRRRTVKGDVRTMVSMTASGERCSIVEGNALD